MITPFGRHLSLTKCSCEVPCSTPTLLPFNDSTFGNKLAPCFVINRELVRKISSEKAICFLRFSVIINDDEIISILRDNKEGINASKSVD